MISFYFHLDGDWRVPSTGASSFEQYLKANMKDGYRIISDSRIDFEREVDAALFKLKHIDSIFQPESLEVEWQKSMRLINAEEGLANLIWNMRTNCPAYFSFEYFYVHDADVFAQKFQDICEAAIFDYPEHLRYLQLTGKLKPVVELPELFALLWLQIRRDPGSVASYGIVNQEAVELMKQLSFAQVKAHVCTLLSAAQLDTSAVG